MSDDARSTSAGRNITVDSTVIGTTRAPGGMSKNTVFSRPPTISTDSDFPATDSVTVPLIGPVESVSVIREAPAGATSSNVRAVPRDQKMPPSG